MAVSRDDLTPKQAAAIIGMSVQWFYVKLRRGEGPPHKKRGRTILINRDDLKAWDAQPVIP